MSNSVYNLDKNVILRNSWKIKQYNVSLGKRIRFKPKILILKSRLAIIESPRDKNRIQKKISLKIIKDYIYRISRKQTHRTDKQCTRLFYFQMLSKNFIAQYSRKKLAIVKDEKQEVKYECAIYV